MSIPQDYSLDKFLFDGIKLLSVLSESGSKLLITFKVFTRGVNYIY